MAAYHDLIEALRWLLTNYVQARSEYTHGLIGDGQGHIEVPGRPDFSYVRPDRFSTHVVEVFNKNVEGVTEGTPVLVGELPWQPNLTQVVDVDWDAYLGVGWGNSIQGGRQHGRTHEWFDAHPGVDTFNVYRRQFGDLKTYPLGSGSLSVWVSPYSLTHMEQYRQWPGVPGLDLSGALPASTGTARMALVYWDPCSGTAGTLGVATGTLGLDATNEALNRPVAPAGTVPSAWVRLAGGQGTVSEFDIYDARMPWMPTLEFATGSCGIWAGIIPIGDPGNNFTGSTVEAALQELADGGGGAPSGPAGGDLTGTYPNPQVAGLRGHVVDGEAPTEGYLLTYTGSAWRPRPAPVSPGAALPTGPAGGDLTGSYPDPTVSGLWGYPLLSGAPSDLDVWLFTGSAWRHVPAGDVYEGWPFTTINVDQSDPDADYSAIQDAIDSVGAGGSATILVGAGSYAESLTIANRDLTIVALGHDARTGAGSQVTVTGSVTVTATTRDTNVVLAGMVVNGQISVTGQAAPTPYVLNVHLKNVYSTSVASARVVVGVYGVVRMDECAFTYSAGNVVTLDTQNAPFLNQIYNSRIEGNVSVAADSTLRAAGLLGAATFSGAGTVSFADKIASLNVEGLGNIADGQALRWSATNSQFEATALNDVCCGRLTLTSGSPVVISDQTAKTTIYFAPFGGNSISLYDSTSGWYVLTFSEVSVSVPSTTTTPFDIFAYNNGGTLALETVNWTNDTTRATALTTQNGVYVKSGDTTRRYLGTGRTTGSSGQTEDSSLNRLLWNYYNRLPSRQTMNDATSHTYATGAWRSWNNDATLRVAFINGLQEDSLAVTVNGQVTAAGFCGFAAAINSTSVPTVDVQVGATGVVHKNGVTSFVYPGLGYSYIQALEYGSAAPPTFTNIKIETRFTR